MIDVTPGLLERRPRLAKAVAEVLTETAGRVEREGFAQHAFFDGVTGLYCTRGHFTQVVLDKYRGQNILIDGVDLWKSVIAGCDMVLAMHLGQGVATWNDTPGRTKDEIVQVLRNVAASVRLAVSA